MKLINDLCSTGFWVSVLLPTFFRFHFGSDVKEFDNIFRFHFRVLGGDLASVTAGRKCPLEISLAFDKRIGQME